MVIYLKLVIYQIIVCVMVHVSNRDVSLDTVNSCKFTIDGRCSFFPVLMASPPLLMTPSTRCEIQCPFFQTLRSGDSHSNLWIMDKSIHQWRLS